jgi:RTX calcium-binding nonapeptide repeat (4 copies)
MSDITVDFAQYLTDTTLNGPYNAADNVTVADDSSILDTLTASQIDGLATNNVDTISATDGVLSWTADQYAHLILGPVQIDPDTFAIMADTGADIEALSAGQLAQIAAEGVATINPSDGVLALSVAQFEALGAMSVDGSADFTIADTGAHIAAMDSGEIAALGFLGVDHLNATDGVLALDIDQYQSLGTVTLTAGNDVTLADTSDNLETLSATDIGGLGTNGIDHIHATDGAWTISLAVFDALGSVTLDPSDTVTLADSGATLAGFTTADIDALATGGVDILHATDGAVSFSVAQLVEMANVGIHLVPADTITLADTGAHIAALSTGDIDGLATTGVDFIDATDDALTISAAQFSHILSDSIALTASDTVVVSDTAVNLATLDFSTLASANVDQLDATTAFTTLTAAQLSALGTVTFTDASAVTLTDSGANIAAVTDFSTFSAHGVDVLNASDNVLTISEAQYQALGTTTLTGSDTVTISDTAANIVGGPNYGTLAAAGIDFLNATTAINVTVNDITNLGAVVFTAGSAVTLSDTGAHISAVANFTTYGTHGVDTIDASNNTLTMNATQFGELGTVTLTAADTVTISDTAAHLSGLTFSALAGKNVDFLNSTNAYTNLTVQNVSDLGTVHFTAASNVTLTDTAAHIQAASDFSVFAAHGVDTIKSSDNALSLTVAQVSGLGTTHLTGADAVTLADTAANLDTYLDTAGTQTVLSTNGVDFIHATGGSLSVDAAAFTAVHNAGAVFTGSDAVTLADTGAHIAALDFTTLAAAGIDTLDASDNALNITAAQYLDIAGVVAFTSGDTVTIADTAAHIEALTTVQIGGLGTNLVDVVSVVSGGDLDWSVAQWQALPGGVSLSDAGGALVVSDSEANIEALTGTQLGALAASGAHVLDGGGTLNFSVSQAEGFLGTLLSATGTVTLVDSAANIEAMTPSQLAELAAAGFDTIHSTDNALTIDAAQLSALGAVTLTGADDVTLADTAANLATFLDTAGAATALSGNGVDTIHATGGTLSIDAQAVGHVLGTGAVFQSSDAVTLADTGAHIAALDFTTLASLNIDSIHATDNALTISLAQYEDIAGVVALTPADSVTVTGNLDDLSTLEIAGFGTNGVDHLLDSDGFNEVIWTVAQWNALATDITIDNSAHIPGLNFVFDAAADLSAVTATQVAHFVAEGAQTWEESPAGDDTLVTWTVANTQAMGGSSFSDGTHVTVVDSAADIQAVADFSIFAAHHIDAIDSTDDTLSLTVTQFGGLGTTTLTGSDAVTLADTAANLNTYLDGGAANGALSANGVDFIHATGGSISVDAQALTHLGGTGTVFASGDTVTFADTGAHIAAFDFSKLAGLNVDAIHATDNALAISLAQYEDIAGVVALTPADSVTVTGNLDNLSTLEIAGFGTNGVDHLLDSDGFNEVIWTVAQWGALATDITIDNANHISGLNFVFDSGDNLSAITVTQIAHFVTEGAEVFEGQPPGEETVTWTVAKLEAMGSAVWASTTVIIADSAANLEAVSDFATFAAHGITSIDSTDDALSLTTAQYSALGDTTLTGADTVTIADTATNLTGYLSGFADAASLSAALSANGVDILHATGGTLSVNGTEAAGVFDGGAVFASGDAVTVADTGAHIAAFIDHVQGASGDLGALGIDTFDASDNALTLTASEYGFAHDGGVAFTAADTVTIADTASNLEALTATQLGGLANIDAISVVSGGDLDWSVAQWQALPNGVSVSVGAGNSTALLVVDDTQAAIQGLSHAGIAALVTQGAQELASTDGVMNLTVDQVSAFLGTTLSAAIGDTVTIADTQAHIDALTATQIGELAGSQIDHIFATDGSVTFTVAQFDALGTVTVASGNTFTVADTETSIEAMGTGGYAAMAAAGVDVIHSTTGSLTVTFDELNAIFATTTFAAGDHVTLTGTQAELFDGQTADFFAGLGSIGIDEISLTGDGVGHLSVDEWNALVTGGTSLDSANTITLQDSAATLAGESASDIAAMSGQIDSWSVTDSNTLVLDVSQLDALSTAAIALTPADTVELSDSESNIEALNAAALKSYVDLGVDIVHAAGGTLNLDTAQVAAVLDNGATFLSADTVTLSDSAASIEALTAGQWAELVAGHVDVITATGGPLEITVAEFQAVESALHGGALTLTNAAVLDDAGTAISALTVTEIGQLAGDNITTISGTGDIDFTQAKIAALGGVTVSTTGAFVLTDSEATIEGLSTSAIDTDAADGVSVIHSTDASDTLTFSVAQAQHVLSDGMTVDNTAVVVSDTGAHLSTLSFAQLNGMSTAGFTGIVDTSGTITWSLSQLNHLTVALTLNGNGLTLSDTEATLEAQNATEWAYIASLATNITANNTHVLNLSAGKISALFGSNASFATGDTVTLADSGANIAALTAAQIGQLAGLHVDAIDASDDTLVLSVAQYGALGSVTLTGADHVTLSDSSANLLTLNFATLAAAGIDQIDATDNALTVSVAQYTALGAVAFTAGDTVTISDTVANISGLDYATLAAKNIDVLNATGGTLALDLAHYNQLGAVIFSAASSITLADTGSSIAALSAVQIGQLAAHGIDTIDTTDNALTLNAAQFAALGTIVLAAGDTVTLADTGASLAALDFATLAAKGVDVLDATDNAMSLTVAKYQSLGTVTLTQADTVTLADTGAHIAALTAAQIGALAAAGIDKIDASNNLLSLSVAQFAALGTVALTGTDTVTLLDTGANLQMLDFSTLAAKGVDILDASDNVLSLTAAQFQSLGTVALKSTDTVTLLDTGAHIAALTVGQFNALAAKGIDILDATDNAYSLTVAKVEGISPALTLAANDTVTVADTEAHIEAMTNTQFAAAVARGIDIFHATNSILNVSVAQAEALLGTTAAFAAGDSVTLIDTGAAIAALTATQIGELAAAGIDTLDAGDNALTLSLAQYRALGTVALTQADTVTLQNDNGGLTGMTVSEIQGLSQKGVDVLESTNANFSFSVAQAEALIHQTGGGHVALTAGDAFYVTDTAANVATLTTADLAALGALGAGTVDLIASGALSIGVAFYNAAVAANVTLDSGDNVTLADTGANLDSLSAAVLGTLAAHGIDQIHATNGAVAFNKAQLDALSSTAVALTQADMVTFSDTEARVEALTAAQFTAYVAQGVDVFHSTSSVMALSESQVAAVLDSTAAFRDTDAVTLVDTAAHIANLTLTELGALSSKGVDIIDITSGSLSLTTAQYAALGTIPIVGGTVVLADTGTNIAALTVAQIQQMAASGISSIDATTDAYAFSVAQYQALGSVALTQADTVTLRDTGTALAALTATQLGALAGAGIDRLDSSTDALALSADQYLALGAVKLTGADTVTLADTGAHLAALTAAQIGALTTNNVDTLDATDNMLTLSLDQYQALHQVMLAAADTVTLSDTGANIAALSVATLQGMAAKGIDVIDTTDNAIALSLAKYAALGSVGFAANDVVTVNGTTGNDVIQGEAGTQILNGFAGDDTFAVGIGNHTLNGSTGTDTASYAGAAAAASINLATGIATTGSFTDQLSSIENATGSGFADTITGSSGANVLIGGAGNDTLTGGGAADTLTGGSGSDKFVYLSASDSTSSATDTIMDFSHAEGDKIDVSAIGNFSFVTTFTHHADQLAVIDMGGGVYKVVGDVNGDGVADLTILVHSSTALVAGDFVL